MTRPTELAPEEQFALLLDGELRPEDVTDEVRSLLNLAAAIDDLPVAAPTPEFRYALRRELVEAAGVQHVSAWQRTRDWFWERTARWRHSARVGLATALASTMIGTTGVAVAAQQALPGQLLYPVKQVTEDVRMGLTRGLHATGLLHLDLARERLEELDEGASSLPSGLLVETLADMDRESIAGAEDLLRYFEQTGTEAVLKELAAFTEEQRGELTTVIEALPSAAVPFAHESVEVLRRIHLEIDEQLGAEPCDCPEDPDIGRVIDPGRPQIGAPGDEPAGRPPRTCDCVAPPDQQPPREPTPPPPDDAVSPPPPDDEPDPGSEDPPPGAGEPVDIVPPLPGPLDGVGDTIDEVVDNLLGPTEPITDPLPVDPTGDPTEDTPLGDTVDDLLDPAPLP